MIKALSLMWEPTAVGEKSDIHGTAPSYGFSLLHLILTALYSQNINAFPSEVPRNYPLVKVFCVCFGWASRMLK